MNLKVVCTTVIVFFLATHVYAQKQSFRFSATVKMDSNIKELVHEDGRLYLFLSQNPNAEPRTQTWPSPTNKTYIFAKNKTDLTPDETLKIENDNQWVSTANWSLDEVPAGEYYVQVLWDQDRSESRIDAPGNLYSKKQKIQLNKATEMEVVLSQSIQVRKVKPHDLSRVIDMKSEILSKWWNKPMHLKAAVLLPHGYDKTKAYPIRYNVAGYGGRYTRINNLLSSKEAMNWLDSDQGPQLITVFLDGEGPFGDSYQMDSENSGPYGEALIKELIPHIESTYRGTDDATTRFVDGCSTGGWVSLGLQLYYPDTFNGVFSYSPDAIEFEHYQLINIYKDTNAFTNEYGYPRPVMRDTNGEPMLSLREFIQYENVLGASNSYLNSGGQFSAHTALYSPKGNNGLPKPLFHPQTGVIDTTVAEHWKKYDFKIYAKEHWATLGPKLKGKIFIWMGDMDHFYLNPATRAFSDFLEDTVHPASDAEIVFAPMEGHCTAFSHKVVFDSIKERLVEIAVDKAEKK